MCKATNENEIAAMYRNYAAIQIPPFSHVAPGLQEAAATCTIGPPVGR